MPRPQRQFTREFKLTTVKLVKQGLRTLAQVARDPDLTESALRNWIQSFDSDAGTREGTTTPDREELAPVARRSPTTASGARTVEKPLPRPNAPHVERPPQPHCHSAGQ